jgi:prepilin peptidase CpaA
MIATVPLILFPFCLIAAALSDARRFLIPNSLSVALVLGFVMAAGIAGMEWSAIGNHVLTAFVVLAVGFGLFCINVFGAGDGKILAAIALWFGWPSFLSTLIVIAFVGGALCLGIVNARSFARRFPAMSLRFPSLARLAATEELKCPYGIAIAIGALLTFRNSPLFELLVARMI